MLSSFEYFPTIIYRDERPEWVENCLTVSNKYFESQQHQGLICQTDHMGNDPDLKFLCDYLINSAYNVLGQQGYNLSQYDLYLSGLWGQEIKGYGGTNVHVHKNSQISGWYFLQVNEKGAYPIFYDPRTNKQMIELDVITTSSVLNSTSSVHFNNVLPGTILFSNSWMQHQLGGGLEDGISKTIHFIISHRDKLCNIC